MRQIFSLLLLLTAAIVSADEIFVSPGPSVSQNNPTTGNAIHPLRSRFHVAWEGTNLTRSISVVLFQYHGKELIYPFEYVVQSTDWTVSTDKNLSFSHLFLFNLFYDGEINPVAVSETFNITDTSSTSTTSSTSSTSSSTSAASTRMSSTTSSTDGFTTATSSTGPASDRNENGGLTTGAKIGIGVAVPAVALLGVVAGWFLFRHRAKKQLTQQQQLQQQQQQAQYQQQQYQAPMYHTQAPDYQKSMEGHIPGQLSELNAAPPATPQELYGGSASH
ncbi:hypothetical protein BKA67DRAFT_540146 [Truncatella angustata]|uniref:Mid2 domain-containing protein n=1 Tax=Truncatella angustata TaxID=152316 RepID=A0A9P8RIG6_9PEZI|nr:uncharacterized protein BKA67DRAFT_540146 [Truncatella angustata]KAH6646643.1 hypothetical protein BKA67DRAFT_540146 [Truncatella angustata]